MLEESRMDKKTTNRSLQQSRPHAVDCKKGTESTHKPWPRSNKKREGPTSAPKNELRKNVPSQRGRGQMDKRPRCRGSNFFVAGTQNSRIEDDDEPEIGSVFVPGSKKQNLNHLLNFMYPSRGGTEHRDPCVTRRLNNQRVSFKHQHDLYLRAYCQFVVTETGDYKVNLIDPDMPLKWEQIEEIVVRGTGKSECPICLGTPVAGRVGLCGHVYCWACILHYGATHEKQPPPCPVCATALHVPDMKPASIVQWESPADEVTMRLVRRLRGSTVVEEAPPRGVFKDSHETSIMPLVNHIEAPYAKLFTATNKQILNILERDKKEIMDQILAEIDTTEIVYLEQALEMLKTKEKNLNLLDNCGPTLDNTNSEGNVQTVYEKLEINQKRIDWFDVPDEAASTDIENKALDEVVEDMSLLDMQSNLNPDAIEFKFDDNDNCDQEFPLTESPTPESKSIDTDLCFTDIDKQNQAKYFYFYQAVDGQQVFLHSLNVRVLNASWGALAAAPLVVCGRVLHRETHFLSEQTRKHMPCTAHLPLHCAFDVVELDLKQPYVTSDALINFSDDIERRAKIRAKHERDEKRRERAYRRTVEGPPKPDISSELLFPPTSSSYGSPPFLADSFPSDVSSPSSSTSSAPVEQSNPSLITSSPSSGLSFAKMASSSGTWRVRKVAAPVKAPVAPEEETLGPRALVLSDAIEAALQASAPTKSAGKKKKSKPKVLFATGMHHVG